MNELFMELHSLQPGLTLEEDVFVNTGFPIMKKNTVLTNDHIEVLRMFNIKKVKVRNKTKHVQEEISKENIDDFTDNLISQNETNTFEEKYIEIVKAFKKEFNRWKSGISPDIARIRTIIVPLLEQYDAEGAELSFLSKYSNPTDYLYRHSIAIGIFAFAIGKKLGLSKGHLLQLGIAGTLVDCGMAKMNSSIIEKSASLTETEFNQIKKHPIYSYQMVKVSPLLRTEMKLAILQHHERLDGSGYPRGDQYKAIHLYSQILAVADVYHAMTSERLYKSKASSFKVLELMKEEQFGKFDINVIDALYNVVGNLSIGTHVKLSNGQKGIVIFIHRDTPYRPIVKLDDQSTIDLTKIRSITIETVL